MQTLVFFKWIHINLPSSNWERENMNKWKWIKRLHCRYTQYMAVYSSRPQKRLENIWGQTTLRTKWAYWWGIMWKDSISLENRSLEVQFPIKRVVSLTHSLASHVAGLFLLCNLISVSCFKIQTKTGCIFFVVFLWWVSKGNILRFFSWEDGGNGIQSSWYYLMFCTYKLHFSSG